MDHDTYAHSCSWLMKIFFGCFILCIEPTIFRFLVCSCVHRTSTSIECQCPHGYRLHTRSKFAKIKEFILFFFQHLIIFDTDTETFSVVLFGFWLLKIKGKTETFSLSFSRWYVASACRLCLVWPPNEQFSLFQVRLFLRDSFLRRPLAGSSSCLFWFFTLAIFFLAYWRQPRHFPRQICLTFTPIATAPTIDLFTRESFSYFSLFIASSFDRGFHQLSEAWTQVGTFHWAIFSVVDTFPQ